MAWEEHKRGNKISDLPQVTINVDKFSFNTEAAKRAEFHKMKFVKYFIDKDKRKIGFHFSEEEKDVNYYKLSVKKTGNASSARELVMKHDWLKKIANFRERDLKQFFLEKEDGFWVAKIRPSFEIRVMRDNIDSISERVKGIYRYINSNKEIVYIGKGNVKERLRSPERKEWDFELIEYSIVEDETEQFENESFWIDDFKKRNHNKLPYFNKNSGRSFE